MGKKVATTVYITDEQQKKLKLLNDQTKVPIAEYIRQGIDFILDQHSDHFPGQLALPLNGADASDSQEPSLSRLGQEFTEV